MKGENPKSGSLSVSNKMNLSELGEDASLQTVEEKAQVQNNSSEGGELFHLNSLPPGYRFNPADAEIIVFYLRKKVDHQPLPPNKIIEVNVYDYDPEELAGNIGMGNVPIGQLEMDIGRPPKLIKRSNLRSEMWEPPRRTGVNDMSLDDCVVCRVYRKDERISERSRYESRLDESSSSSSKIPRLELDPNPNEADNPYEE
ncbi:hypothetical protein AAG906_032697 [Vitis piasezkii]